MNWFKRTLCHVLGHDWRPILDPIEIRKELKRAEVLYNAVGNDSSGPNQTSYLRMAHCPRCGERQ